MAQPENHLHERSAQDENFHLEVIGRVIRRWVIECKAPRWWCEILIKEAAQFTKFGKIRAEIDTAESDSGATNPLGGNRGIPYGVFAWSSYGGKFVSGSQPNKKLSMT